MWSNEAKGYAVTRAWTVNIRKISNSASERKSLASLALHLDAFNWQPRKELSQYDQCDVWVTRCLLLVRVLCTGLWRWWLITYKRARSVVVKSGLNKVKIIVSNDNARAVRAVRADNNHWPLTSSSWLRRRRYFIAGRLKYALIIWLRARALHYYGHKMCAQTTW